MPRRPPRAPRADRVASLLQQALGRIFIEDFQDPESGFLTVTRVEMSADLLTARVDVAVFGDVPPDRALRRLESRSGAIRRALAARVNLKYNPTLLFRLDPTPESDRRIDRLLKKDPQ